ncbi:TolC family protein, partial [Salibacteraceae bacterium]|nr:TolC family protein [Salibacteraceae bacterium]
FNHFSSGGSWFPTSVIGVQLNVPIFAGGMRHNKIQQAKVSVEQANLRLDQTEQGLFLDMASKKSAYETAINKLDNSSKNIELAGKIKKQTQIKYSEGMSSSVELTQTENQYLQSQMNYIMAVIEVIQAKADLDYAIGTK